MWLISPCLFSFPFETGTEQGLLGLASPHVDMGMGMGAGMGAALGGTSTTSTAGPNSYFGTGFAGFGPGFSATPDFPSSKGGPKLVVS